MGEFRPPNVPPSVLDLAARWRVSLASRAPRRVALWEEDRAAFVAALLGAWSLGIEVVLPGNLVAATIDAVGARVDGFIGPVPSALAPAAQATPLEARFDTDSRLVLFTSGSTSAPATVEKRLGQLLEEVAALEATFGAGLSGWDEVVSTVSHQHLYGLLFSVLWPLATGRPMASQTVTTPEALEASVSGRGVSLLVTVPAHLKRLPDAPRWPCSLARVFSSGGPLPEDGARRCLAVLGTPATEVFGSTETGGIAWRTHPAEAWRPFPGVTWRAEPDGRLAIRSPFLATADWFLTSDLVEPAEGSFRLVGRADRVVKLEEKRVSLGAIEAALRDSGWCDDARAVVLEGPRAEIGAVCLRSTAGRGLSRKALVEALRRHLEGRVDRVALPRRFRFVDAWPLDAQGKVASASLLTLFRPTKPKVDWVQRADGAASGAFVVDPSLSVLEGHFPGQPVVPGVAQLDWALTFGEQCFGLVPSMLRMEAVKFQTLMRPGHHVTIELQWRDGVLRFSFEGPSGRYSSGRLVLRPT